VLAWDASHAAASMIFGLLSYAHQGSKRTLASNGARLTYSKQLGSKKYLFEDVPCLVGASVNALGRAAKGLGGSNWVRQ